MSKKIKMEDGKIYKEHKPFYKKWWFIVIAIIFVFGLTLPIFEVEEEPELAEEPETEEMSNYIEDDEEDNYIEEDDDIEDEEIEEPEEPEAKEKEAEENSKKFPADSVATFSGNQFKGMNYHYKGIVIGESNAQSVGKIVEQTYGVKNDRDYLMLVTPIYEIEIPNGVELEVYGNLNGNGYDSSYFGVESVNKNSGLINAYKMFINGKEVGIEYLSPDDL